MSVNVVGSTPGLGELEGQRGPELSLHGLPHRFRFVVSAA